MKLKKIISMVLAASVFMTGTNLFYADTSYKTETEIPEQNAVVEADVAVSDDALTTPAANIYMNGGLETNVAEDGQWKATVTGVAGSPSKVSGEVKYKGSGDNAIYTDKPYYSVIENDNGTVDMRMGVFNDDGEILDKIGSINTSSDGLTMYYKELKASDSFELSATATVKNLVNNDNQVAFGLALRDEIRPMTNYASTSNMLAVGPLHMNNVGQSNGMLKAFARNNKRLITADQSFINEASAAPQVGDVIDFNIRKNGDAITLTYGDQKPVTVYNLIAFDEDIYAGLFVVRGAEIEFSNIKFNAVEDKYTSIQITSLPDKTTYIFGDVSKLDAQGLVVEGTLADGTKQPLTPDEYDIVGWEDIGETVGTHTVTVVSGDNSATFDINVIPVMADEINVDYAPAENVFYTGEKFSNAGIEVSVKYNNGTSEALQPEDYVLKIGESVIDNNYIFSEAVTGSIAVTAELTERFDNWPDNVKTDEFTIMVKAAVVDGIGIAAEPAKLIYYTGEEFDSAGLAVKADFRFADGVSSRLIDNDTYTVMGFDSSRPADKQTLTVVYNGDTSKTAAFDIAVKEKTAVGIELTEYPRTTFAVGESFDAEGMLVSAVYNNKDTQRLGSGVYYYYDGSRYYTTAAVKEGDSAEADGTYTVDAAFMTNAETAPDYYIDLTGYDNSKTGKTEVTVVCRGFANTVLPITIEEPTSYIWKPGVFGSSSMGNPDAYPPTGPAEIYVNDILVDGDTYDQSVGIMENGKLTNVNNIRLNAWDKAGKISTGVDGLAYYYTRVGADSNFALSADVRVNRYIIDPDDADDAAVLAKTQAAAEQLLGRTVTVEEAIDMSRDGQECFGLQAMDAIPLFAKDGLGDDNLVTSDINSAQLDEHGEPVNIWEAYLKDMSAVDYRGDIRLVIDTNVSDGFSSNLVLAGGYSGATYSRDITSSNYYKNTHINRINLMVKKGIDKYAYATGTRMEPYGATDTVPLKNDKYNITLQRISYGYKITVYNYQTGEERSRYAFDTTDGLQGLLVTQADKDNIWVGFRASRWADITVSNIELYESSPETDFVFKHTVEKTYTPHIYVSSDTVSEKSDYELCLEPSNPSGGFVTVKLGENEIYSDELISGAAAYPLSLKPAADNEVTIIYKPSSADKCTSYEPVVRRISITNKDTGAVTEYPFEGGKIYFNPESGVIGKADGGLKAANIPMYINDCIITAIGENAFSDCDGLAVITIPETVTSIADNAFNGNITIRCEKGSYAEKYAMEKGLKTTGFTNGDLDLNGINTAADAAELLQQVLDSKYRTEVEECTTKYMNYSDVTADNILTAADSAAILQRVLDNSFVFECEK